MRSAALFQFWSILLHPAVDGGVINVQTSFDTTVALLRLNTLRPKEEKTLQALFDDM